VKRGALLITPHLLMEILKGLRQGEQPRAFRVVRHGLPMDVRLIRTECDEAMDAVVLVVESEALEIDPHARVHSSGYPILDGVEMTVA
jgi:hypothetical protein